MTLIVDDESIVFLGLIWKGIWFRYVVVFAVVGLLVVFIGVYVFVCWDLVLKGGVVFVVVMEDCYGVCIDLVVFIVFGGLV